MRYPADQKAKTRRSILDAAGRVFRRKGFQGAGVDAVMKEAGLTHGGFYSHFKNKESLFAEAVLESMLALRPTHRGWTEGLQGGDALEAFIDGYLSPRHAQNTETGCPVPALVSEVGRSGEGPKQSFEEGLSGWADFLAASLEKEDDPRFAAFGVIAACIGGLALSRAVDDPDLSRDVLESTRNLVLRAYTEPPPAANDASPEPDPSGRGADHV